jgi:hypothetical protein
MTLSVVAQIGSGLGVIGSEALRTVVRGVAVRLRAGTGDRGTRRGRGAHITGGNCRRRCVTWANLHRLSRVADHVTGRIIVRLCRPVTAGRVNRLRVAWVDDIAPRH